MDENDIFRVLHRSIGNYSYNKTEDPDQVGVTKEGNTEAGHFHSDDYDNNQQDTSILSYSKVISVYMGAGTLAAISLNNETRSLEFSDLVKMGQYSDDELVETILIQTKPDLLICNSRFASISSKIKGNRIENNDHNSLVFDFDRMKIEVKPQKDFQNKFNASFLDVLFDTFSQRQTERSAVFSILREKNTRDWSIYVSTRPLVINLQCFAL